MNYLYLYNFQNNENCEQWLRSVSNPTQRWTWFDGRRLYTRSVIRAAVHFKFAIDCYNTFSYQNCFQPL